MSRFVRSLGVATAVLAICFALTSSGRSQAQQPGVFEVLIPASSLGQPIGNSPGTLGQATARITAQANGVTCATVDLSMATTSDVVMQLGMSGQPPECALDGAKVTFVNGARCDPLSTEMVLAKGTRQTLQNLAPKPPGSTPSPSGCVRVPDPTPFAQPQPAPQLPAGGIPPPPGITAQILSVVTVPAIVPPQTGDAGLAGEP